MFTHIKVQEKPHDLDFYQEISFGLEIVMSLTTDYSLTYCKMIVYTNLFYLNTVSLLTYNIRVFLHTLFVGGRSHYASTYVFHVIHIQSKTTYNEKNEEQTYASRIEQQPL